jgi:hypothetical protein
LLDDFGWCWFERNLADRSGLSRRIWPVVTYDPLKLVASAYTLEGTLSGAGFHKLVMRAQDSKLTYRYHTAT